MDQRDAADGSRHGILVQAFEVGVNSRNHPVAHETHEQQGGEMIAPGLKGSPAHPALTRVLGALAYGGEHAHEAGQEKKAFGRTEEAEAHKEVVGNGSAEMVQGHLQQQ